MRLPHRTALILFILSLSISCDQATKHLAGAVLQDSPGHSWLGGVFRLQYAENPGAFLSLGATLPEGARYWVFTIGVGLLLLGILAFALFNRELDPLQASGYALIVGGGASNWVDRVTHNGTVVDFMNIGFRSLRTGIFNVADVVILLGIALLLFASGRQGRRNPTAPTSA